MKKYIYLLVIGFSIVKIQAQNVADGLRLGQSGINGTARFQAMSGAFGSLGGDFSAINVNPAGSAIFNNNQWSISLSDNILKNSTNYFGDKTKSDKNSVNFNQAAGVFVFENYDTKSDWNKFSLAINYENVSNFDNDVFSVGTNNNSLANYFLSYANTGNGGAPIPQELVNRNSNESVESLYNYLTSNEVFQNYPNISTFAAQQAMLAFYGQGNIIDADNLSNPNSTYFSNVRPGGKYFQRNSSVTRGQNSKVNFNVSAQYQKWLSIGVNLNSHFTDYKESTIFTETNNNPNDAFDRVKSIQFNNDIHTFGSGFSLQIGAIAKVNDMLRLGLAYESPTWYELNDELTQSLKTIESSTSFTDDKFNNIDPNTVNIYEPYQIQTPIKFTGSAALIFAKKGLVSLDITRTDYSNTTFGPVRDFDDLNKEISDRLTSSLTIKLGGEYRINKWSLRGGYRLEQSPYKNKKVMGDLYGISTGIGYNWGDTKLDVSYAYSKRNNQNQFFKQGLTDFSTTTGINNNVTLTLVFEL